MALLHRLPRLVAIASATFVLLAAHTARADEGPPAAETTVPLWYGWQTLIADGASLAAVTGGGMAKSWPLAWLGIIGYGAAAPTMHLAHGNGARALTSLAIRLGAPIMFGVGGAAVAGKGNEGHDVVDTTALTGFAIGALVGMGAAVVIDAAFLARDRVPSDATARRRGAAPRLRPLVAPTAHGAMLGAAAVF